MPTETTFVFYAIFREIQIPLLFDAGISLENTVLEPLHWP